jgi:hypothetical protein
MVSLEGLLFFRERQGLVGVLRTGINTIDQLWLIMVSSSIILELLVLDLSSVIVSSKVSTLGFV